MLLFDYCVLVTYDFVDCESCHHGVPPIGLRSRLLGRQKREMIELRNTMFNI